MRFEVTGLGGIAPLCNPLALPQSMAQIADNCRFTGGDLDVWRAPANIGVTVPSSTLTIYRFGQRLNSESQYWFRFDNDVDIVRGPVPGDTNETTYFTGLDYPRFTDATVAVGGGAYPDVSWRLGLPAPTAAPVVIDTGPGAAMGGMPALQLTPMSTMPVYTSGAAGNNIVPAAAPVAETRAYVVTWIHNTGTITQESAPSPYTLVNLAAGHSAQISRPSWPAPGYMTTGWRIYRTVGTTGDYYFVAEVPMGSAIFVDNVLGSALGEPLQSLDWLPPPANLRGLVSLGNGVMAGFVGRDLYFCDPFHPYAWPDRYNLTVEDEIVALAPIGGGMIVLTAGAPYEVSGLDPASMSMRRYDFPQACVSKKSVVTINGGVLYASPDGLCFVGPSLQDVVTKTLYDRPLWQSRIKPTTLRAYRSNDHYIAFYDNGTTQGGFVFAPNDPKSPLTPVDVLATAGYTDATSGQLYLLIGTQIAKWDAGAALTNRWRSKNFSAPQEDAWMCMRHQRGQRA